MRVKCRFRGPVQRTAEKLIIRFKNQSNHRLTIYDPIRVGARSASEVDWGLPRNLCRGAVHIFAHGICVNQLAGQAF